MRERQRRLDTSQHRDAVVTASPVDDAEANIHPSVLLLCNVPKKEVGLTVTRSRFGDALLPRRARATKGLCTVCVGWKMLGKELSSRHTINSGRSTTQAPCPLDICSFSAHTHACSTKPRHHWQSSPNQINMDLRLFLFHNVVSIDFLFFSKVKV